MYPLIREKKCFFVKIFMDILSKSVVTFMNFGKLDLTRKKAPLDQTKIMFYAMELLLIYVVLHFYGAAQNPFKIAQSTTT